MQLFFAVVSDTTVSSVEVNGDDLIASVEDVICTKCQYTFPARKLSLYHTKRDTAGGVEWLTSEADDLRALQEKPVRAEVEQAYLTEDSLLYPTDLVEDHFTDVPSRGIHILVVLPSPRSKRPPPSTLEKESPTKLPRLVSSIILSFLEQDTIVWVPTLVDCPPLDLPQRGSWLRIPHHYLEKSGVRAPVNDGHAILYIRQRVVDEWTAIEENSVEMPSTLWIVGTPGVGKSCAAFAFACGAVDRSKWDVLWIHYDAYSHTLECIKFVKNRKWTCNMRAKDPLKTLESLLGRWTWPSPRPLIVFFNDYIKSSTECDEYLRLLTWWQRDDRRNRRVVCVTSMVTRDDHRWTAPTIKLENGKEILPNTLFELLSWTLEEYLVAVTNHEFFVAVRNTLKPETAVGSSEANAETASVMPASSTELTPQELIERKFYVAGGSAFAMFQCSVSIAIENLEEAVPWGAHNIDVLARGAVAAAASPWALCLLSFYSETFGSWHRYTIVSHLAVRMLAVKIGPQRICDLTWRAKHKNPAMDSFAFEAFVLASIANSMLGYECQDGTAGAWTPTEVRFLKPFARLFTPSGRWSLWYVPTQWYPGGYDAVIRETVYESEDRQSMRLVFVRMMPPTQHPRGLDAAVFHELIHKAQLASPLVTFKSVELRFIVPLQVLSQFTAPVSAGDFKRQVVDPLTLNVACRVQVVGVQFPGFSGIEHIWEV